MTSYLKATGALALEEFLRDEGFLKGMRRGRANAIIEDLCVLVNCLVSEAVEQATDEVKVAAVMAGLDALECQQTRLFANLMKQFHCPQ